MRSILATLIAVLALAAPASAETTWTSYSDGWSEPSYASLGIDLVPVLDPWPIVDFGRYVTLAPPLALNRPVLMDAGDGWTLKPDDPHQRILNDLKSAQELAEEGGLDDEGRAIIGRIDQRAEEAEGQLERDSEGQSDDVVDGQYEQLVEIQDGRDRLREQLADDPDAES